MSWIEGIGDEVTLTVAILLGLSLLLAAWFSTGTREIHFLSVIIIHLRRRVHIDSSSVSETRNSSTGLEHTTPDRVEEPALSNIEHQDSTAGLHPKNTNNGDNVQKVSGSNNHDTNETVSVFQNVENAQKASNSLLINSVNNNLNSHDVETLNARAVERTESEDETDVTSVSVTCVKQEQLPASESELRQRRLDFFVAGRTTSNFQSKNNIVTASGTIGSLPECPPPECLPIADNILDNTVVSNSVCPLQSSPNNDVQNETPGSRGDDILNNSVQNSENTAGISGLVSNTFKATPSEIRLRIKFLNDTQRLVTASLTETIGNFRRRLFSDELSQSKLVRFIFNGQDLRNDTSTLESYNIIDNSVLHCLVTQPPQANQNGQHHDDGGFDIGVLMFPLLGLLLGLVWYGRFVYRQFFNFVSTVILAGITFLYMAAFIASFRRQHHEHLE